jgi:hypothetical protein
VDAGSFSGHSLAGVTALFQTAATDGSNASPTIVARTNTAQPATSYLFSAENLTESNGEIASYAATVKNAIGQSGTALFGVDSHGAPDSFRKAQAFFSVNGAEFMRAGESGGVPTVSFGGALDGYPALPPGILNVLVPAGYGTIAASFQNADTSGTADIVCLGFLAQTGLSMRTGTLEFQHSGFEDGKSFFAFGFGTTAFEDSSYVVSINSDGNVDAASFSVASVPGQDGSFVVGGTTYTITKGIITAITP